MIIELDVDDSYSSIPKMQFDTRYIHALCCRQLIRYPDVSIFVSSVQCLSTASSLLLLLLVLLPLQPPMRKVLMVSFHEVPSETEETIGFSCLFSLSDDGDEY